MPIRTLTDFEKFSITRPYLNELSKLNNSTYAISGPAASRIIGIATLSIASFADALLHSVACFGVGLIGIVVSPYNFLAYAFYPEYCRSENYELSSSLIHLMMSVESLFNAAILPFLCLLNPDRASRWMSSRTAKDNLLNLSEERIAQLQQHYDQSQRNCASLLSEKNQCQADLEEKGRMNQDLKRQLLEQGRQLADEQIRANQNVEEKERAIADLNAQLVQQIHRSAADLLRERNQLLVEKYAVGEQFLTLKNQTTEMEKELQLQIVNLKHDNQTIREKNFEIIEQANQETERAREEFERKLREQNDRFENQLFRETTRFLIEKSEVKEEFHGYKITSLKKERIYENRINFLTNGINQEIERLKQELEKEMQMGQFAQLTLDGEREKYEQLHHKYDTLIEELNESKVESDQRAEYLENYNKKWEEKENAYREIIKELKNRVTELEKELKDK